MTITLQKIHERKQTRKRVLDRQLANVIQLLKGFGAEKIIVFGSYAEDCLRTWSDLDVICIMPSGCTGKEWMERINEQVDRFVGCDIAAYTAEELQQLLPVSRF